MRTIEITTTQNVVLQSKLAALMDRIIGFILDAVVLIILFFIGSALFPIDPNTGENWPMLFWLLLLALYSLILESLTGGQTIGKMIVGVKVVKTDGSQPNFIDYFRRWALRWIDIIGSFGAVAMTSISTSEKGQRLGDKIADTIVVKKNQQSGYKLKDILSITRSEDYEPKYPEIRHVPESNMLTLKRLLLRRQKYPSLDTYQEMVEETGKKFEENLGIKKKELGYDAFLKQLLKDYVILTR